MYDFWSLRLLARAAPDTKLLVMLRDPVERFRSGLAKHLRKLEGRDAPLDLDAAAEALFRGMYAEQLRRVFELFPRERVLVIQYERCARDPVGEMGATLEFLGLEPFAEPPDRLLGLRRRAAHPKPPLDEALREDLIAHLRADVARLAQLCPELDLSLWPNFAAGP